MIRLINTMFYYYINIMNTLYGTEVSGKLRIEYQKRGQIYTFLF